VSISKPLSKSCCAALCLSLSVSAWAQTPVSEVSAEIRRTTFGVPHIRAADERGLGYGIGYAYAQDNLCLLANEVVTVNGERSRYFGPEQMTLEERDNLSSDLFFTWLNTPQAVAAFWQAQTPEVRDLIEGYVAGYNRQLGERKGLPEQCDNPSVRPITTADVVKLTRRLLVEGGAGQFGEALVAAARQRWGLVRVPFTWLRLDVVWRAVRGPSRVAVVAGFGLSRSGRRLLGGRGASLWSWWRPLDGISLR